MPPSDFYLILGHCYRSLERFTEALEVYKKAVEIAPSNIYAHLGLAVLYVFMGRDLEARAAASQVLSIDPDFSLKAVKKASPNLDRDGEESYYRAARKAGLPD